MLDAVTQETKLMFVCSPGNPTAKAIPLADIERLADSSFNGIIVVDEAYIDFSTKGSAVSLINRYPNIVVLQTLSKAFGLAGIRLGFALGSEDVIQLMNNVKAPYNVNKLTSEVAQNAMKNVNVLQNNVDVLLEERSNLMKTLNELEYVTKVYPSDANFILFQMKAHAKNIYKMVSYLNSYINYAKLYRV